MRRLPGAAAALARYAGIAPATLWLVAFFLAPVALVGAYSVGLLSFPAGSGTYSWDAWRSFLEGSVYLDVFWRSVVTALVVSAVCLLLAYPIAYYLSFVAAPRRRYVLLLLVLAPFFTSYLLRVLAWKVMLGNNGVINSFLFWTGIRADGDPVTQLLYSRFAVGIVLVYVWLPFVCLPIYLALEGIDRRLVEAASDLGASRRAVFRRVVLPLSLPGALAAFVFVFVPSLGEFVTPMLVGGSKGFMYGNAIQDLFTSGLDWQTGSVLAMFLLLVVVAVVALGRLVAGRRPGLVAS